MANIRPWDVAFDVEEVHKGIMGVIQYALRECGGILWPILYGALYYYAYDSLSILGKVVFLVIGLPLIIISFIYPYAWRKYEDKKENQINNIINTHVQNITNELRKIQNPK